MLEKGYRSLKSSPCRLAFPDAPTPTSWALTNHYYPRAVDIVNTVREILLLPKKTEEEIGIIYDIAHDVPDNTFTGPF